VKKVKTRKIKYKLYTTVNRSQKKCVLPEAFLLEKASDDKWQLKDGWLPTPHQDEGTAPNMVVIDDDKKDDLSGDDEAGKRKSD
jgi:hypothetical protein